MPVLVVRVRLPVESVAVAGRVSGDGDTRGETILDAWTGVLAWVGLGRMVMVVVVVVVVRMLQGSLERFLLLLLLLLLAKGDGIVTDGFDCGEMVA